MTIDSSVTKINPPGLLEMVAGGGLAAVIVFSVGVFLSVIPILGWILGPALMITAGLIAIVDLVGIFRRRAGYSGHCPQCGAPADAGDPGSVIACSACHSKLVHRDSHLLKIA